MSKNHVMGGTSGVDGGHIRWKHRPEPSTWGDFGTDDTLGRINLLTPQKVREGVAEVFDANIFALGLPLNLPGGNGLNANRLPRSTGRIFAGHWSTPTVG